MSPRTLLEQSGIDASRVRLLARTPNRVYRIRASDGRDFSLRFRRDRTLTPPSARLQQRWLAAIARDTDVTAPLVVPLSGKAAAVDGDGDGRQVALFTWVDGRRARGASRFLSNSNLTAVGTTVAKLHRHAERFRIADARELRCFDMDFFFPS